MSNLQDIFIFSKEPNSVNDFDEIVCTHNGDDIAIGNFLKFYWFPKPYVRFYDFNEFLNVNSHLTMSLCTDELLIRLYKQTICLIAYLRNIPIKSFPEEYQLVKEKFQANENYEKSFLLADQKDCFYKFYTYNFANQKQEAINISRLNSLIKTIIERGLSDQVLMHPEDINNIFSVKEIIHSPDGKNIYFFCNVPVMGNNFDLIDKYVDSIAEYIIEQESSSRELFVLRFFLNDFSIMFQTLNQNEDEDFKQITKKYLTICSNFTEKYPGFISSKHCTFLKDIIKLKKQTKTFAHSVFEIKTEIPDVDFEVFDTKTVVVNILSVLKYQRDKYEKVFEPKYIKSTLQKNFESLKSGILSIQGNDIYFTFSNQNDLNESIFNQTIDEFMSLMLNEILNPKRNFLKEYEILMNKAIMENDMMKISHNNSTTVAKVNKF